MKSIKNNGNKIVHIGRRAVMPGEEITVEDSMADTKAIKALAKTKIITVTDVVFDATVQPAEQVEDPPATMTVAVAEVASGDEEQSAKKSHSKTSSKPKTEENKTDEG